MDVVEVSIPWEEWRRLSDCVPRDAVRLDAEGHYIFFGRLHLRPAEDRTDGVVLQVLKASGVLSNETIVRIEQALGLRRLIER